MSRLAWLEKGGTGGAVLAALACPICFPKLALIGAAVGFGAFAPYERYIALGVQALFVVAFVGQVLAFRVHRNRWLLGLAAATTLTLFVGYYVVPSSILLQIALLGLVVSSVWHVIEVKRCAKCVQAE
jgi:mercuric ion transport protein